MTTKNYLWILYAITATIVITIGVQVYWNYTNYELNKQRVTNEIQLSIDNALEEYYAEIAKSSFFTIIKPDTSSKADTTVKNSNLSNLLKKGTQFESMKISSLKFESQTNIDSMILSVKEEMNKTLLSAGKTLLDSVSGFTQLSDNTIGYHVEKGKQGEVVQILKGKKVYDSITKLKRLNTIMISMDRNTLEYAQVDSLLKIQFEQKNISPNYNIKHFKSDSLVYSLNSDLNSEELMSVSSKSTYLKPKELVVLEFENPLKDALKLSFTGILISFFLAAAIISCLFYLLNIIRNQKQVAEVKNDLISNITHEFKTPISTIGVALEGLKNFNALDDKVKTLNYLSISNDQLEKLNVMVEKLLETATLDSDNLELHKEHINMVEIIQQLVEKHDLRNEGKKINFHNANDTISANVDTFHIENAINNIIDNAIKYGGEKITIELKQNSFATAISIADNGNSLKNINKDKIFEKFYRVPKGNTHDVKGFGIGLYYSKKIIENHGGTIQLNLDNQLTTFKISLPNE
ncbi:sensor histidine kinase [Gelidibacter salicanalis]|uniref:histidine kinase n=1 Tax=Gelidibacter salicanalis TaxID=291193 RepID=A0A934KT81_9FLAO|nr:HAMP domain-containing sensor histidine kinase [Gelidibacter salicanalis]MBJ7880308.1 HAMP domain-containing histidine kinase [Gelidibacter salicanalis]